MDEKDEDYNSFLEGAYEALVWGAGSIAAELLSDVEDQYVVLIDRVVQAAPSDVGAELDRGLQELQLEATGALQSAQAEAQGRVANAHREAYRAVARQSGASVPTWEPESVEVDPYARRGLDRTTPQMIRGALERGIAPVQRQLPALRREVSDDLLSRSLGRLLERGADANAGVDIDLSELGVETRPPQVWGNLKRVTATEMRSVVDEASKTIAAQSPAIDLVEWTLSPFHGGEHAPDVCDVLATEDLHGYGDGLYHPALVPAQPHPHCQCAIVGILKDPSEWGAGQRPRPDQPTVRERHVRTAMQRQEGERAVTEAHAKKQAKEMRDVINLVHETPRA